MRRNSHLGGLFLDDYFEEYVHMFLEFKINPDYQLKWCNLSLYLGTDLWFSL